MSRRRTVLQLEEPRERDSSPYSGNRRRAPSDDEQSPDDDDDDPMGDMPTPERLVPPDMPLPMPNGGEKLDIDNKVANFLAEIDALDQGDENSRSPGLLDPRGDESPPHFQFQQSPPPGAETPPRSPPRSKPGAYSMFVRGDTEFNKRQREGQHHKDNSEEEKWPEEPKSLWQQLKDEKSNYPYYWNTETNQVVWDMPSEFQQYLILHKEYEEKIEKGLREGKLKPENRPGAKPEPSARQAPEGLPPERSEKSRSRRERRHSSSSDSSRDSSSDSDRSSSRGSRKGSKSREKPSSTSYNETKRSSRERDLKANSSNQDSPELPDSTDLRDGEKKDSAENLEDMDFDIDDIDKELEMALERKRQELMRLEDADKKQDKDQKKRDTDRENKDHHRKKDEKRDDERKKHDRDRKRDDHRDERRHKDRDKDKKHSREKEEKPKLSLKDRLKMEMEMKLEKERRKKKAIEDMMARELEKTVGMKNRKRHHRDVYDEPRKRYKDDPIDDPYRRDYRDEYDDRRMDDYDRYDVYDRHKAHGYDDRDDPPARMTPPPPTAEMVAVQAERKSKVVDYGHGRARTYDQQGDSDNEGSRTGYEERDLEMKKLEALQLAELALSKLEFLEVTKKGLSKLQILLIELETRHQDWQAGGLSTNHFLMKLREANWQLEQYEESAAPQGWICSWDRDYRRYFYTHKLTSKTQWDYPDADDISAEEIKVKDEGLRVREGPRPKDRDGEISSTTRPGNRRAPDISHRSKKPVLSQKEILSKAATLPPPPPPPAEEHPVVKSLQLMYGSTSESESDDDSKDKKSKKEKKEPEMVPPPPPSSIPLPPPPDDRGDRRKDDRGKERGKDKKDKHKRKKKKEKSKRKDKEKREETVSRPVGTVGLMLPHVPGPPEGQMPTQDEKVPGLVYGPQSGPEIYGQNDEPLQFVAGADGNQPVEAMDPAYQGQPIPPPGEAGQVIMQGPQLEGAELSHPAESYLPHESHTFGAPWTGAVDQTDYNTEGAHLYDQLPAAEGNHAGPSHEGAPAVEMGTSATPAGDDKKKKKKEKAEKMATSNISLKKKHVSSMVMKWQKVKKEVEEEERNREEKEAEIRQKLRELQEELG